MTQEDKELLLRDLCARLPYYPVVHVEHVIGGFIETADLEVHGYEGKLKLLREDNETFCYLPIEECNPYLRPMSSMTEEEKEEIAFIRDRDFQSVRKWIHDESIKETGNICPITCGEIDYCNKKHLDYRGLIEKGLAIKAPADMYNIKKK